MQGFPIFDVPKAQGPVISGHPGAVEIKVEHTTIAVPRIPSQIQTSRTARLHRRAA